MNFNSNPCIGNNESPPTAPRIKAKGAVHAGHPGVNAANAPQTMQKNLLLQNSSLLSFLF